MGHVITENKHRTRRAREVTTSSTASSYGGGDSSAAAADGSSCPDSPEATAVGWEIGVFVMWFVVVAVLPPDAADGGWASLVALLSLLP